MVYLPFVQFVIVQIFLLGAYEIGGGTTVAQLDARNGTHHSIIGDFVALDYLLDIDRIEARWQAGYLDFINLMPVAPLTAQQIAEGALDDTIRQSARNFATWQTGKRTAILAPLPEMNGTWTSYGYNPEQFKLAYKRIRSIYSEEGARPLWVFVPNGWSTPPYSIADYYPGDESVDAVGISGFNFCMSFYQSPVEVFNPYVQEVRGFTSKPLFISQYGTSGLLQDQWLNQAFDYFYQNDIHGAIYFNVDKECDWAINASAAYRTKSMAQRYFNPVTAAQGLTR